MHPPLAEQREFLSSGSLPASRATPARARAFVRAVIAERSLSLSSAGPEAERLGDDAALLVSELTSNALMHAGTDMEVRCRTEVERPGEPRTPRLRAAVVEVVDQQPAAPVPGGRRRGWGLGIELVNALAESWGVTYRRTEKAVWFRLSGEGGEGARSQPREPAARVAAWLGEPREGLVPPEGQRPGRGPVTSAGTFLAEASELLAGQLDEDMIAALASQLLVPRLADWCAVWLTTEDEDGAMRLSRVWHADERRVSALRDALAPEPPARSLSTAGVPWPWPEGVTSGGGSALAFSLVSHNTCLGTLVIGRSRVSGATDTVARTVEDVARRVAQAVVTARKYTRQTRISRALQGRQLPRALASLPGVESAIVYEPHATGQTVGGDFYDLFPADERRWCFLLGDVQGKDPEAMSVTGLTRHMVRLLAREGHSVGSVLDWVNAVMAEEAAEAVRMGGEAARPRFLSMVYGELAPQAETGGALCTLASAGHPLPLRLSADGKVDTVVRPQLLLGIDEHTRFTAEEFYLARGETLLCVTDGVTERRSGGRLLDDHDGLAAILRRCAGMGAAAVAERVRRATHDFGPEPLEDDIAVLVLHATP